MRGFVLFIGMSVSLGCAARTPAASRPANEPACTAIEHTASVPRPANDEKPTPSPGATSGIAGWLLAGSGPAHYALFRDPSVKHGGDASARLMSMSEPGDTFGTVMQTAAADAYLGKRLKLSAFIRTGDVRGWTGLWMRIDRKNDKPPPFDNMERRPIRGTTDWIDYAVVLDVPEDAVSVNFGVLQAGSGTTWIDDVHLDVVELSVPRTDAPSAPVNLDFDG